MDGVKQNKMAMAVDGVWMLTDLGVAAFFKMVLHDNFVHADLHPGNILVRPAVGHSGGDLVSIHTTFCLHKKQINRVFEYIA